MELMFITNKPDLAYEAEQCGVSRIFVDLESIGKKERQGHLDTFISNHKMEDISKLKNQITKSKLLVRLNPINDNTKEEVDESIKRGADMLMLPMFYTVDEIKKFSDFVAGRVKVIPLIETYSSAIKIKEIAMLDGVDEIYIGLNDLHLDMKKSFMFELLSEGFIDNLVKEIKEAGKPFGFGGVARVGEGIIPGEKVLSEHLRLGSTSTILSRTFNREDGSDAFKIEVKKLFDALKTLKLRTIEQINSDKNKFKQLVDIYVRFLKK